MWFSIVNFASQMRRILILYLLFVVTLQVGAVIPPGYYDKADGLKKENLKAALRSTVTRGVKMLSYGSGEGKTWSGFYQTDRYEGNRVRDRYSYGLFCFSASNPYSAVTGMNIEHSFPKSWWGGSSNNAYKDLFNLMPCEEKINSSKSNYPMGRVTAVDANASNGCTKIGNGPTSRGRTAKLWEPADEWKGDFARTYFYMVTAYSDLIWAGEALTMLQQDSWPTLQEWAYKLLLTWSREDPVDAIEQKRNETVYGIQGNRNPYVDFPNLAEYVWGDSVSFAFYVDETQQSVLDADDGSDENPDVGGGNDGDDDVPEIAFRETFDGGTKGSYSPDKEVECTVAKWMFVNGLIGADIVSSDNPKAARIKSGGSIEMTGDKTGGCGKLSFYAGLYNNDTNMQLTVSYSVDKGRTWTVVVDKMEVGAWTLYEYEINEPNPVRLKFEVTGADSRRVNLDEVQMTDYVRLPGDVNGDGRLTLEDVYALAQLLAHPEEEADSSVVDVDGDGEFSISDVTWLIDKLQ